MNEPLIPIAYQRVQVTLPDGVDTDTAVRALQQLPGMEPRPDSLGNDQAVFLFHFVPDNPDPQARELVMPADVDAAPVVAALAQVTPPPAPAAETPLSHALAPVFETVAQDPALAPATKQALAQAIRLLSGS